MAPAGDQQQAIQNFGSAVRLAPAMTEAHRQLSLILEYSDGGDDVARSVTSTASMRTPV